MQELSEKEVDEVSGGGSFRDAGIAVIGIGLSGGPVTGIFGLIVGGSMIYVGNFQN